MSHAERDGFHAMARAGRRARSENVDADNDALYRVANLGRAVSASAGVHWRGLPRRCAPRRRATSHEKGKGLAF